MFQDLKCTFVVRVPQDYSEGCIVRVFVTKLNTTISIHYEVKNYLKTTGVKLLVLLATRLGASVNTRDWISCRLIEDSRFGTCLCMLFISINVLEKMVLKYTFHYSSKERVVHERPDKRLCLLRSLNGRTYFIRVLKFLIKDCACCVL